MPDLRDVLRHGADVTAGLPDMPTVWTRAVRERRRRRAVAAAGAAVGAAAVVGVVTLLGSVLDPGPPVPPQPATTPRLAPAQQLPPYPEVLAPGTYDAGELGLPYDVTVTGRDWSLAAREPGWLSLHRGGTRVNIQRWDTVIDPASDSIGAAAAQAVPADLVDWVVNHPRLDTSRPRPTVIAGEAWQVVEVSVASPLRSTPSECGSVPCVVLGQVGSESAELLVSERALVHVRSDGEQQTVLLVSFPAPAAAPAPAVTRLIDSLRERPLP